MVDVLPDSRLTTITTAKGAINRGGAFWVPIYCASCGKDGGSVPEENMTFAFYLCDPCAVKYGEIAGQYMMPDHVFWELVKQEQLEKHHRLLTPDEVAHALRDPNSAMSTLARDRAALTPHGD